MVLQTGNYQPFSYDELVKPIDNMTKMQMAQEDAVNKLQQQSATLDKYLNESDTPYTYAIYDRMKKKLQMQADNLARYGLTPDTRQTVNDLATQYTADIVPIASAQSKKQEQVKNFIDNNNKTPGFMTSYDPSKVSVDEFFLHPDMMYQSTDVDKIRNIAKETVKTITEVVKDVDIVEEGVKRASPIEHLVRGYTKANGTVVGPYPRGGK